MPGLHDRRSLTKRTQLPLKGYVDCSSTVERLIVAQEKRVRLPPAQLQAVLRPGFRGQIPQRPDLVELLISALLWLPSNAGIVQLVRTRF